MTAVPPLDWRPLGDGLHSKGCQPWPPLAGGVHTEGEKKGACVLASGT